MSPINKGKWPTPEDLGIRDVKIEPYPWAEDYGAPILLVLQCPQCDFIHPFVQRYCDECDTDMWEVKAKVSE